MPDISKRNSGEHYRPDDETNSKSDKAASVPENANTSTRTSRRSNSDLPFPFDSESSLDLDNCSNGTHKLRAGGVMARLTE